MATTTAVVSGLQTIEMCKVLLGQVTDNFKNAFINLGVPMIILSNPAGPKKFTIPHQKEKIDVWTKWQVDYKQHKD